MLRATTYARYQLPVYSRVASSAVYCLNFAAKTYRSSL